MQYVFVVNITVEQEVIKAANFDCVFYFYMLLVYNSSQHTFNQSREVTLHWDTDSKSRSIKLARTSNVILSNSLSWHIADNVKARVLQHPWKCLDFMSLTLSESGYNIFVLWNWPETSSCQLPYQRHSSSTDCARELNKSSNGSASLLVCTPTDFLWVTS